LFVVALGRSFCVIKAAVVADCAALHDGPRRHIAKAVTNKGPEADAGGNGVDAHPRLGLVPAIAALWVGLVGRPLQRVVAHIFLYPQIFVQGLGNALCNAMRTFLRGAVAITTMVAICPASGGTRADPLRPSRNRSR
jgi:hypothetical protein